MKKFCSRSLPHRDNARRLSIVEEDNVPGRKGERDRESFGADRICSWFGRATCSVGGSTRT